MINKNKNMQLRKRIVRVFIENKVNILSTREIKDKLSDQYTEGPKPKRYSTQPPITKLSNVLKFYTEFKRCETDTTVREINGKSFKMATWKLTEDAEVIL